MGSLPLAYAVWHSESFYTGPLDGWAFTFGYSKDNNNNNNNNKI